MLTKVHTFTTRMNIQESRNFTPQVAALYDIPIPKAKPYREFVDYSCDIFQPKVFIKWRWRGECVPRKGRHKEMIRQIRTLICFTIMIEDGKELEKATCQTLSTSISK